MYYISGLTYTKQGYCMAKAEVFNKSVALDLDVYELLKQRAKEEERSVNKVINRELRKALEK